MDPRRREVWSDVNVRMSWSMGDKLDGTLVLLLKLTVALLVERNDGDEVVLSSLFAPLSSAVLTCGVLRRDL